MKEPDAYQQVDMAMLAFLAELSRLLIEHRAIDSTALQSSLLVLRDQARGTQSASSAAAFDGLLNLIFGPDRPSPPTADVRPFR